MSPRILFLDDDPVLRVLRMVLSDAEYDPWIRDYFAPEKIDPSRLVNAAKGCAAAMAPRSGSRAREISKTPRRFCSGAAK